MLCEAIYLLVTPPDAVQVGQLINQEQPHKFNKRV